jgi:hypothetical protein
VLHPSATPKVYLSLYPKLKLRNYV